MACGFVKDLEIDTASGAVAFKLELTTPACPVKDQFKREATAYVQVRPRVCIYWFRAARRGRAAPRAQGFVGTLQRRRRRQASSADPASSPVRGRARRSCRG